MKKQVLILNYHSIGKADNFLSPLDDLYTISEAAFRSQMHVLQKHKIKIISLHDLSSGTVSEEFAVAITFDDGHISCHDTAAPILISHKIPATFFVLGGPHQTGMMNWNQVKDLVTMGFTIGSHSITHRDIASLHITDQRKELAESKAIIESRIGKPVDFFSFPFGRYNKQLVNLAEEAGYRGLVTTDFKLNNPANGPLLHRWSIKNNLTTNEFEQVIVNQEVRNKKISRARFKRFGRLLMGRSVTDRLNRMMNSAKNK